MYDEDKKSQKYVSEHCGVSLYSLRKLLKERHIHIRGVQEANGIAKDLSDEIKKKVIENYLINKQGLQTCGREYHLSQATVETILKNAGIEKRTYTEAKQIGRKYPCNDDYFKVQTPNMAYILGFIASDGNIAKKENCITIELAERDTEVLEQIRAETQSQRPIKHYTKNSTQQKTCKFAVWSSEWKKDLAHYNILPNKTFILKPPYFLQSKYYIDYIKGYFDGDGTIYQRQDDERVCFEIAGASKEVIYWIRNVLINQYYVETNEISTSILDNGTVMYRLYTSNKNSIKQLYNLFYKNSSCNLSLQRKKNKFTNLINTPRDSNSQV